MNAKQKVVPLIKVPIWMSGFYCIFAITMVPWMWHLWNTLPALQHGIHWRAMWAIFDAALLVQALVASYFLIKKSVWACLPLVSLATLFVADMWFDFMTSVTGVERFAVLRITIAAEIPLTILSVGCAVYILRQALAHKE